VFTFTPTQTHSTLGGGSGYSYYITEPNQRNYIQMDIVKGLWCRPEVKQFWVYLPQEIRQIDTASCNASLLHSDASKYRLPFPPELKCNIYADNNQTNPALRNHRISLDVVPYTASPVWPPPIADMLEFSIRLYLNMTFDKAER